MPAADVAFSPCSGSEACRKYLVLKPVNLCAASCAFHFQVIAWLAPLCMSLPGLQVQDRLRFNLFKSLPELKQILRSDWWPEKINHGFTVWIYPAYVALLLWGPQDPTRNFGISLFWNYWWPVIFLVYPFLGRVWCAGMHPPCIVPSFQM